MNTNMELTQVAYGMRRKGTEDARPYGIVLFTKPFKLESSDKEYNVVNPSEYGKGRSYIHFAKIGQKILWLNYNDELYDRLKTWPLGCNVAYNDEGKYVLVILPGECERTSFLYNSQVKTIGVWAPESVIIDLEKRLWNMDHNVWFSSRAALPEGREIKIRMYFQIFENVEELAVVGIETHTS